MSVFVLALLIAAIDPRLESQLTTSSGKFERYSAEDERDFYVTLTRADGTVERLEDIPTKFVDFFARTSRRRESADYDSILLNQNGSEEEIARSRRVFDIDEPKYECEAICRIGLPTPLSPKADLLISKLRCESDKPLTETRSFRVIGKGGQSWADCASTEETKCLWDFLPEKKPEAATQVSALGNLWTAEKSFQSFGLTVSMLLVKARAWMTSADKSRYDSRVRTIFYGAGNYLDALDGTVVVHEFGHAVIDDLNSHLWGYESEVVHEAVADFIAADVFDSACIGPYDAQEVPDQKCLRNLSELKIFPIDFFGESAHHDSLVLSGSFWEVRKILPAGLTLEALFEAIIRSPKSLNIQRFWNKFERVYERILLERPKLKDQRAEIQQIGRRHGLE